VHIRCKITPSWLTKESDGSPARAVKTTDRRTCSVCNTLLDSDSEVCPVCALKSALESENHATVTELRFEHYQVLKNERPEPDGARPRLDGRDL
jgi:hypothetical protein